MVTPLSRMPTSLRASLAAASVLLGVSSLSVGGHARAPSQPTAQSGRLPDAEAVKAFIAARVAKHWVPPKTPWGHPDIQGIFTTKDEANTPFERPDEWAGRRIEDITSQEFATALAQRQQTAVENAPFAGGGAPEGGVAIAVPIHWFDNLAARNSRPWLVIDPPDGKMPSLTPEGRARPIPPPATGAGPAESYAVRGIGDRCIIFGTGGIWQLPFIYGNSYQILQTPDHVVMRYEMIHEARMIPLDGRPHVSATIRGYFGDSRGHWEGNTLVVETTNIHDSLTYRLGNIGGGVADRRGAAHPVRNLRIIERFTRTAANTVEWTTTIDDPATWTRAWTYSFPLTEDNTQEIYEYACHEANYSLANILSAGRAADQKAGKSAP